MGDDVREEEGEGDEIGWRRAVRRAEKGLPRRPRLVSTEAMAALSRPARLNDRPVTRPAFIKEQVERRLEELELLAGKVRDPVTSPRLALHPNRTLPKDWARPFLKGAMDFEAAWEALHLVVETKLMGSLYAALPRLDHSMYFRCWSLWGNLGNVFRGPLVPLGPLGLLGDNLRVGVEKGKMAQEVPSRLLDREAEAGPFKALLRHKPQEEGEGVEGEPLVELAVEVWGPFRGWAIPAPSKLDNIALDLEGIQRLLRGKSPADAFLVHNTLEAERVEVTVGIGERRETRTFHRLPIGARFLRYSLAEFTDVLHIPTQEVHTSKTFYPAPADKHTHFPSAPPTKR